MQRQLFCRKRRQHLSSRPRASQDTGTDFVLGEAITTLRSGDPRIQVGRQPAHDDLLAIVIPKKVEPEAMPWLSRLALL